MKETKFYLVRHGQSLGNAKRIILGHTDWDLSDLGYLQAKMTAEALRDVKFDKIYSSDLKRAHNTALPFAEMRSLPIIDRVGLREIYTGDWEEKSVEDILLDSREMYEISWQKGFSSFTFPNGDSVMDASQRFYCEVLQIAKENEGKTVLLTSHAAVIRGFWCLISKLEASVWAQTVPFPTNASYSTFTYCDGVFTPIEFSCDSHFQTQNFS